MHKRAEQEFDRQAGGVLAGAFAVVLLMAAGWGAGVILAYL